jgi:hypothetical protein
MTVREVLEKLVAGELTVDEAERAILYDCDDCTYTEEAES